MNLLAICRNYFLMGLVLVSATATADVNDTSTERRLSIPGGTQGIVIPRGDWTLSKEQPRPGDTAVYYMLISEKRQMIFSVYIDKTSACNSAEFLPGNRADEHAVQGGERTPEVRGGEVQSSPIFRGQFTRSGDQAGKFSGQRLFRWSMV